MKKIGYIILIIMSFMVFINVKAETNLEDNDNYKYKCVDHLKDKSCGSLYNIPKDVPHFTSLAMNLVKIFTPIVLIIKGLIDLFKAMTGASGKDIDEERSKFFKRLVPAVAVFLVILLAQALFRLIGSSNESPTILACINCFLNNSCSDNSGFIDKNKEYCAELQNNQELNVNINNNQGGNSGKKNDTSQIGSVTGGTGVVNNICTSTATYKGKSYSLTEDQKLVLAKMILKEHSSDTDGMKAVASQMANLYEYKQYQNSCCVKNRSLFDYISTPTNGYSCGGYKCRWYASADTYEKLDSDDQKKIPTAVSIVEEVIVNGNRTLPLYIREFDEYSSGAGGVKNKLPIDQYEVGVTNIKGDLKGEGIFWCISPGSGGGGNLFYYSNDYKQYIEKTYPNSSASSSTPISMNGTEKTFRESLATKAVELTNIFTSSNFKWISPSVRNSTGCLSKFYEGEKCLTSDSKSCLNNCTYYGTDCNGFVTYFYHKYLNINAKTDDQSLKDGVAYKFFSPVESTGRWTVLSAATSYFSAYKDTIRVNDSNRSSALEKIKNIAKPGDALGRYCYSKEGDTKSGFTANHIGLYVGDGYVVDNNGSVSKRPLANFVKITYAKTNETYKDCEITILQLDASKFIN